MKSKDDFKDLLKLSELSLKKVWDNEEDEIWNEYLKNDRTIKKYSKTKRKRLRS